MKTVLIFGGASGIGRSISQIFNDNGYAVSFTYFNSENEAENLVSQFNKTGNASRYFCNVAKYNEVSAVVKEVIKKYGKIDCLVCNAGVALSKMLTDTTEEDFDQVMSVNQKGVFNCCKATTPYMVNRQSGNIVIISSIAGQDGISCESVYSMSKGGLLSFSSALAKELGESGIRVNTVCPGLIDTKMNQNLTNDDKSDLINKALVKRIGKAEDVANAVFFLAENDYVTAANIAVDGGLVI